MPNCHEALAILDTLAPLSLAAGWDNVGLLLEGDRAIRSALLTIDLTQPVLEEAIDADVDLVIAYHPPVFTGLKRVTRATHTGRSLLELARRGVHIYSPHTALDAVAGGLNDWLLSAFGEATEVQPIEPDPGQPEVGVGRIATLLTPRSVGELTLTVKRFLELDAVRVCGNPSQLIRRVAVCPGAGGSVFAGLKDVDLLLTGEMRHHDVLGFAARGTATMLTDHTNTERGYLPIYAARIAAALGIEVRLSERDADPLTIR